MKTFLDEIAEALLRAGGNDFSNTCIVLPNRRAGVFLRDAISKSAKKAIWAPSILSIEDFVFQLAGDVKVEQSTLLFSCFEVYQQSASSNDSLEFFANWAPTFLADVNELDINLIDAEDIFAQLYSVERIKKWNPDGKPLSDFQQKHLQFVKQLFGLYSALRKELQAKNLAYQGMAFRKVAENAQQHLQKAPWQQIWFAGFNALTTSEEEIIKVCVEMGIGRSFWDMDHFYTDDPVHEAGTYLRRYAEGRSRLKLEKGFLWNQNHFSAQAKQIQLIGAQRNIGQVEACATVLEGMMQDAAINFSDVALVLNDEKLLFPLLDRLPAALSGINITMGYGLRQSRSATFIDKLFQLHMQSSTKGNGFYHADVLALQTDGLYLSTTGKNGAELRKKMVNLNRSFLSVEALKASEFDEIIFGNDRHTVASFLQMLKLCTDHIRQKGDPTHLAIESKFLRLIERCIVRLTDLQSKFEAIENLKTLHLFWQQLINGQQLDFVGEPITGLQIMGMLETRNLDFKHVIMLGVNEGMLPSTAHASSFFTFDVRRVFGLACQNERDAVTAYHFYRLLQRAEKVHLIYDQDVSGLGGGEKSRFVQQLQIEAPSNVSITEEHLQQTVSTQTSTGAISIRKGELEMQRLVAHADYGFSPSAMNTYRSCGLKFYLRYVAGIKEAQELSEDLDHAQFGTVLHDALENLYTPFVGKPLSESHVSEMRQRANDELMKQFSTKVSADLVLIGKNLLAFEVAKAYLARVLDHDLESIQKGQIPTVLLLESQLASELVLNSGENTISVKIKGKADRIDRLSDGTIRLIDYKTGSFDKNTAIKSSDELRATKADNAFQLLTYAFMFASDNSGSFDLAPTAFYLRSKQVEFPITVTENGIPLQKEDTLKFIGGELNELLSEIFNSELEFSQTETLSTCKFCDFASFCQRQEQLES